MDPSNSKVIYQQELSLLEFDRITWTNAANEVVRKARTIDMSVRYENVSWGDGSCLLYSICDQIERPEIVNPNLRHFEDLNRQAKNVYGENPLAWKKLYGTVTNQGPLDMAFDERQHRIYNQDLPFLTPWSFRQLLCNYVLRKWCVPNISVEMKIHQNYFVQTVNSQRKHPMTFEDIVRAQRNPREFSWDFFIQAASEMLNTQIWLMTDTSTKHNPYPLKKGKDQFPKSNPILISFINGNHYQSLRPHNPQSLTSQSAAPLRFHQGQTFPSWQKPPKATATTSQLSLMTKLDQCQRPQIGTNFSAMSLGSRQVPVSSSPLQVPFQTTALLSQNSLKSTVGQCLRPVPPQYVTSAAAIQPRPPKAPLSASHLQVPPQAKVAKNKFKCNLCPTTFKWKKNIKRHCSSIHGTSPPEEEDLKKDLCDNCGGLFLELNDHIEKRCSLAPGASHGLMSGTDESSIVTASSNTMDSDESDESTYPWLCVEGKQKRIWMHHQTTDFALAKVQQPPFSGISEPNALDSGKEPYLWPCPVCKQEIFCTLDLHEEQCTGPRARPK